MKQQCISTCCRLAHVGYSMQAVCTCVAVPSMVARMNWHPWRLVVLCIPTRGIAVLPPAYFFGLGRYGRLVCLPWLVLPACQILMTLYVSSSLQDCHCYAHKGLWCFAHSARELICSSNHGNCHICLGLLCQHTFAAAELHCTLATSMLGLIMIGQSLLVCQSLDYTFKHCIAEFCCNVRLCHMS